MKGVNYITDEKNRKKAVVIDFEVWKKYEEQLEDIFDGIIASERKNEPLVSWEQVKKNLRKKGKL